MIVLGVTCAILALASVGLAIRIAGLRKDVADADHARHSVEQQLQSVAREFANFRERIKKQTADLQKDIDALETELQNCSSPESRRAMLRRLLSQATGYSNGGH